MLPCTTEPARGFRGYSSAHAVMPNTRFTACSTGIGFTAPSRLYVRKSQNILGQKKHSSAAAIWSVSLLWLVQRFLRCYVERNIQAPAVRMMSRAQWFLINLPMMCLDSCMDECTAWYIMIVTISLDLYANRSLKWYPSR